MNNYCRTCLIIFLSILLNACSEKSNIDFRKQYQLNGEIKSLIETTYYYFNLNDSPFSKKRINNSDSIKLMPIHYTYIDFDREGVITHYLDTNESVAFEEFFLKKKKADTLYYKAIYDERETNPEIIEKYYEGSDLMNYSPGPTENLIKEVLDEKGNWIEKEIVKIGYQNVEKFKITRKIEYY